MAKTKTNTSIFIDMIQEGTYDLKFKKLDRIYCYKKFNCCLELLDDTGQVCHRIGLAELSPKRPEYNDAYPPLALQNRHGKQLRNLYNRRLSEATLSIWSMTEPLIFILEASYLIYYFKVYENAAIQDKTSQDYIIEFYDHKAKITAYNPELHDGLPVSSYVYKKQQQHYI